MKILTIAATPFFSNRGCHIRIYNEAKYLQKFGNEVEICTYHIGEDIKDLNIARVGKVKWYRKISPGFTWGKIWLDIKLLFLCITKIKKFNPDVIHAHLYEGLAIGFLAKKIIFRKIPIILDLQGDIKDEFNSYNKKNKILNKLMTWLAAQIINSADFVIVSSENALRSTELIYKNKKNIEVVRDSVDLDLFLTISATSVEVSEELKEIKKRAGGKLIIIYAGGLSDSKGVGGIVEEFLRNEKIANEWFLVLFGKGEDCARYKKMSKKNKSIFFTSNSDYFSLPHYLKLADVAIDPKNNSTESSGKLVLYMASSLPIICFDNNFNRSRLGNGGFYIKSNSDLGTVISEVKKEINNIKIRKGLNYKLEKESEKEEVAKIEKIIKNLIKKWVMEKLCCPICGGTSVIFKKYQNLSDPYKTVDDLFYINKCKDCGHLFLGNPMKENEISKVYEGNYGAYNKMYLDKIRFLVIYFQVIALERKFDSNKKLKILELGAGEGIYSQLFNSRGHEVTAVDIDNKSMDILSKKGVKTIAGDFIKINFKEKFDIVIMSHILEHFYNPRLVLEKTKKIMNKNGFVYIKTPNSRFLFLDFIKNNTYLFDIPRHINIFSDRSINILLNNVGFKTNVKDVFTLNEFINFFKIKYKEGFSNYFVIPLIFLFLPIALLCYLPKRSSRMVVLAKNN